MATVNNILRATLSFAIAGNSVGNLVHHYRVTVGTETDYVLIATDIETALELAYAACELLMGVSVQPGSLELSEWDATALEWDGKASVTASGPEGAGTGVTVPTGIAALIRFPTAELRRQARKFIPGLRQNEVNADALSTAYIADLVVSGALLNNDVTAGALTLRPCTFNDTVGGPRFNTFSDFSTTSIVNTNVAYQRRRQPGAGI